MSESNQKIVAYENEYRTSTKNETNQFYFNIDFIHRQTKKFSIIY